MYKRLYFTGIAAYIVMFLFSILFYKERIILVDTANGVFNIIKENSFAIGIYRFGNVFNQWLPVLAAKMNASLDTIMMCYSSAFILYYFMCYLICGTVLKRYEFALLVLLFNTLFTADTFYWIPSELPQGMALLMVVFAMLYEKQFSTMRATTWMAVFTGLIILVFYHPLLIFVMGFSIVFFLLHRHIPFDRKALMITGGGFFALLLLKTLFLRTPYERHSMSGMKNFITLFPDYFTLYSNRQFLANCISKYYWIPVVFMGVVVLYYQQKQWKQAGLFLLSFFGYMLLVNVSYPSDVTPVFYIENLYLPLAVFLSLPLIFNILPMLVRRNMAMPFLLLVLVTFGVRVSTTQATYAARLNWERRFMKEHGDKKMIYPTRLVPMDTMMMVWGTPYEFWLLSTTEQSRTVSIIIDPKPESRLWADQLRNSLLVNWNVLPYSELNPKYFRMTDSTTPYLIYK